MAYLVFLAVISCIAGVLGGLTGTGGIILPPILIEFCNVAPHMAMSMTQASFIIPSTLAVIMFARKGQFDWRVALPMAIPGCICSFLSAMYLKPLINSALITIIFALCIMLSGVMMLWKTDRVLNPPLTPPWRAPVLALLGASVGVLAGVTGSGSNTILVPAMVFFGLEVLSVLGACQLFAVLSSATGTAGNLLNMHIDMIEIAWLVGGQIIGIWMGVRLAQRMDTTSLKKCVGVVCFLAGAFVLLKAVYGML